MCWADHKILILEILKSTLGSQVDLVSWQRSIGDVELANLVI
jgi:hypothetical protein